MRACIHTPAPPQVGLIERQATGEDRPTGRNRFTGGARVGKRKIFVFNFSPSACQVGMMWNYCLLANDRCPFFLPLLLWYLCSYVLDTQEKKIFLLTLLRLRWHVCKVWSRGDQARASYFVNLCSLTCFDARLRGGQLFFILSNKDTKIFEENNTFAMGEWSMLQLRDRSEFLP